MHLSIVTDEISADFHHALQVCRELDIDTVELRKVEGKNIVLHAKEDVQRIQALVQAGGFHVCAIASPFLKCAWPMTHSGQLDPLSPELDAEWEILDRSLELAQRFGAPLVRTFSFLRVTDPTSVRVSLLEILREATRRVEARGLKLSIENEHACNVATGEETGWLLQRLASNAFGVTWDPGNEAALGSPAFPHGYQHVRGRVLHVHIKDVNRVLPEPVQQASWVKVGSGRIDYIGQLRALVEDGYNGHLSLETHYNHPTGGREQATRESLAALRQLAQQAGIALT